MNIKITGSGSYIPNQIVTNSDFAKHQFLNEDGSIFNASNEI
ncbi:TPA: ketoacyl-ACP synthase III, partial [Flavobacterium psychrophilum]